MSTAEEIKKVVKKPVTPIPKKVVKRPLEGEEDEGME